MRPSAATSTSGPASAGRQSTCRFGAGRRTPAPMYDLLRFPEHRRNRVGNRVPPRGLALELFPPRARQPVVLGVAIVLGDPPFRLDPPFHFEPVQRGIERPFFHP